MSKHFMPVTSIFNWLHKDSTKSKVFEDFFSGRCKQIFKFVSKTGFYCFFEANPKLPRRKKSFVSLNCFLEFLKNTHFFPKMTKKMARLNFLSEGLVSSGENPTGTQEDVKMISRSRLWIISIQFCVFLFFIRRFCDLSEKNVLHLLLVWALRLRAEIGRKTFQLT